jgi:hypothetical protein
MTVEELRQRLQGVDGARIVRVQVMAARREARESYAESTAGFVSEDAFIISD